jgi:hypothetical protein
MNRLTAIGLASLVAYGLLLASKYTGVVSAARQDAVEPPTALQASGATLSGVQALNAEPRPRPLASFPTPSARPPIARVSAIAQEFRTTRDLKAFADGLSSRGDALGADERYFLAKTLEECQFVTSITEDLAAYSAKQRRQFLASLPTGDPLNEKRIAAYEAVDNTQRCLGFKDAHFSSRDIDALYSAAAAQGDARAQARIITAELSKNLGKGSGETTPASTASRPGDELSFSMLTQLLDSKDPEALLYVGQFLAQNAVTQQLRVGPNGEVPEPSAFLGGFSLVACDLGQDCTAINRDLQQACAFGGFCNAQSFEELYQNFLASPWAYSQAMRYRILIRTAIDQHNYGLIGLTPKLANRDKATL